MFSINTFVALFVFAAPFLVHADVSPTIPAPGAVYNEGSTCTVGWTGDTNSTTIWLNLDIELMSGDNFNMVYLTSNYCFFFLFLSVPLKAKIIFSTLAVAQGLDGTKPNQISFPCPNVTPNSAIYFYQFVAPNAVDRPWVGTGRFAIASASGVTTPPANPTQPDGEAIPWGVGALVNPSDAVPQPSFATSNTSSSSVASNSSTSASSTSAASSSSVSGSAALVVTTGASSASPVVSLSTSASPTALSNTSGAMTTFDIQLWGAAAAAAATLALSFIW